MKTIVCVASIHDPAGLNQLDVFSSQVHSANLTQIIHIYISQTESVHSEDLDAILTQKFGPIDCIIFFTKHESKAQKRTFCIHTQGNFATADLGGTVGIVGLCPIVLKNALFQKIHALNQKQHHLQMDCVLEATHHGPDLQTPCIFVEIGSTITEWVDKSLAEITSKAVIETLKQYTTEQTTKRCVAGIGGTHVCSNYTAYVLNGTFLLGHVCPSYMVERLTPSMIREMQQKHTLPIQFVMDTSGMNSAQKNTAQALFTQCGIPYTKLHDFTKLSDLRND
jgi:D-tyrosyl-tRNA(Tyr) deacylase